MGFIIVTPMVDGSHGWDAVGPFATEEKATEWLDGREGIVKPLVAPAAHLAARADGREDEAEEEA